MKKLTALVLALVMCFRSGRLRLDPCAFQHPGFRVHLPG